MNYQAMLSLSVVLLRISVQLTEGHLRIFILFIMGCR